MGQITSGFAVDGSLNLLVNIAAQSLGAVTISGTVTANQGGAPWSFVGNVASGASDSGDPVKTGAVFNTTQPTVTTGQRVDAQATARGALIVATGVDAFTVAVSGTVAVTQSTSPWVVAGNLTNDNANPSNSGITLLPFCVRTFTPRTVPRTRGAVMPLNGTTSRPIEGRGRMLTLGRGTPVARAMPRVATPSYSGFLRFFRCSVYADQHCRSRKRHDHSRSEDHGEQFPRGYRKRSDSNSGIAEWHMDGPARLCSVECFAVRFMVRLSYGHRQHDGCC